MMASNVALEFKNTGNTNICSRHYTSNILEFQDSKVFSQIRRMKEFTTCDLFSYYRFKMESEKLKSYTQAFKKRVLIRLEENDNNKTKTAKEFIFTERICNDGFNLR